MNTYVSVNKALKDYIKMFKILKCFIYKNLYFSETRLFILIDRICIAKVVCLFSLFPPTQVALILKFVDD